MKKILILATLFIVTFSAEAQYETSLGLRLGGWENGVTLKHFLAEGSAIEGILSTRWRGYNLTGLYELQSEISDVDGLYWYIGGGAHIGHWDTRYYNGWGKSYNGTYTILGIDGIIGLEYVIPDVPISISADWKPAINLIGWSGWWPDNGALSVRYIF